jgi:hypothetical protein
MAARLHAAPSIARNLQQAEAVHALPELEAMPAALAS